MTVEAPIIILGAGPAGLAAGYYLAHNGLPPLIFEKQERIGGLCRTLVHKDFRFDIGPHRWFTRNQELDRWFKLFMADELIHVNRFTSIYFGGKFFVYPVRSGDILKKAGGFHTIQILSSYIRSWLQSRFSDQAPSNMEEAYIAQFGRKLYEMFFKCYSEKIWGLPCTEISADWVDQRTQGFSVVTAIRNAVFGRNETHEGLVEVEEYLYPELGYGRIYERMAEEIIKRGGKIFTRHQVTSLAHDNHNVKGISYLDEERQPKFLAGKTVISSIPLTLLAKNLSPRPPEEILNAVERLRFRDLITVNVMLNRERVTKETWIYVQDQHLPFARLYEPKNVSPYMAPPNRTSIVAELFCTTGDDIWNKPDQALIEITIHHLAETLGLIKKEDIIEAFVFRASKAYPMYDQDYQRNVRVIQNYLDTIAGLQIIGRGGTFHYHTSDLSVEMGFSAARNLLSNGPSVPMPESQSVSPEGLFRW